MILAAAQSTNAGVVAAIIVFLAAVLAIVSWCLVFSRAGQPWWAALIPYYNMYVLLKILGRPPWWLLFFFIPLVNLLFFAIIALDLARSFGRGTGFGIGLIVLTAIFLPIFVLMLVSNRAQYIGPAAAPGELTSGYQPAATGIARFDPQTGQPLRRFDPQTGKRPE